MPSSSSLLELLLPVLVLRLEELVAVAEEILEVGEVVPFSMSEYLTQQRISFGPLHGGSFLSPT